MTKAKSAPAAPVERKEWQLSPSSVRNLEQCHKDIQAIIRRAAETYPTEFKVICGHRSKAEQDKAVREKRSKTPYPKSKHNQFPSLAVDIVPLPLDWNNLQAFVALSEHVLATAREMKSKGEVASTIRWGGDWDMDGNWKEHSFFDGPHFEII